MIAHASRILILLLVLGCFWLALSGLFKPLLLTLGVVSSLFVAWITLRKGLIQEGTDLSHIHWGRWCRYIAWLVVQIVKSAVDVSARILDPRLPISPTVDSVPAELADLTKVIYANSITLTPGTVSIKLTGDRIVVHALTRSGMEELKVGGMYSRIKELEK